MIVHDHGALNSDHIKFEVLNQINVIYCTQAHLFERFTETINIGDPKEIKKLLRSAIALSKNNIKSIDHVFSALGIGCSFTNLESLISYLEDIFAQVENSHDERGRCQNFETYLIFNQEITKAANAVINRLTPKLNDVNFMMVLKKMNFKFLTTAHHVIPFNG